MDQIVLLPQGEHQKLTQTMTLISSQLVSNLKVKAFGVLGGLVWLSMQPPHQLAANTLVTVFLQVNEDSTQCMLGYWALGYTNKRALNRITRGGTGNGKAVKAKQTLNYYHLHSSSFPNQSKTAVS